MATQSRHAPLTPREKLLIGLEVLVAVPAIVAGVLFLLDTDGRLLGMSTEALGESPFTDYLVPGLLLLVVVGLGFLGLAMWTWVRAPHAAELAVIGGTGLVLFEAIEYLMIGFNAQQAIVAMIGVAIAATALTIEVGGGRAVRV